MIIAIMGLRGSGKDTVADILSQHVENVVRIAFADKMKDCLAILMDWDRKKLQGITAEDRQWRKTYVDPVHKITPEKAMTLIGGAIKDSKPTIFADIVEKKISQCSPDETVIITDARFKEEFNMLKAKRAIFIRVDRPQTEPLWATELKISYKNLAKCSSLSEAESIRKSIESQIENLKAQQIHRSEYEWMQFQPDEIITNNSTISNLRQSTIGLWNALRMNDLIQQFHNSCKDLQEE